MAGSAVPPSFRMGDLPLLDAQCESGRASGKASSLVEVAQDLNALFLSLRTVLWHDFGRITGNTESAGLNRHVVGDARALQERRQRLHPDL